MTAREVGGPPDRPVRALVLAESLNPEFTSVPLVAWHQCQALRAVADVHVVTQVRNRDAVLRAGWREGHDVTILDNEKFMYPLWRLIAKLGGDRGRAWTLNTALSTLGYYSFEKLAWQRFLPRLRAGEFDVVHRLSPLSPAVPSPIARRCRQIGVPFVLGPLNGGVPWPKGFFAERRREGELLSVLRGLRSALPGLGATFRHASAILVGSRATFAELARPLRSKCVYLAENGVDPARFPPPQRGPRRGPLRLAFAGRLVPCKGVEFAIEAVAPLVRAGRARFDVYGDGPEMARLRAQVLALEVSEGVSLHGWIPQPELLDRLAAAEVFLFPSVREFGGGALLEAMAAGLAPIVLAWGGPRELVTGDSGIVLPLPDRSTVVAGIRSATVELAGDADLLRRLQDGAFRRATEQFSWQAKAKRTVEVYRWVTGAQPDLPAPASSAFEN